VDTGIYDTCPRMTLGIQCVGLTLQQVGQGLVDGKVVTTVYEETLIELTVLSTCCRILELSGIVIALEYTAGQSLLDLTLPIAVNL
jgi:uncharacterized membrane-anchored protein